MEPVELDKALQPAVATAIGSIGLSPFINFKDACNYELDFLKHIDSSRDKYYDADYVDISIRRYEKYWLPLLAELTAPTTDEKSEMTSNRKSDGGRLKYAPPIDIHWVWHVHMLAPVSYITDCKVRYSNFSLVQIRYINNCKSYHMTLRLVYVAGYSQWKNIRSSTLFAARVSKNARNHKTFMGKEISTRTF